MTWLTVDDLKSRLQIPCDDPSQDVQLQASVDYAIALVEEYCKRNFEEQQQTEDFYPVEFTVYLKNWPLTTVDEVWIDGVEQTDPTYHIDPIRGVVYFDVGLNNWSDKNQMRLVYTAGYSVIPTVLKNATLDIAAARFYTADDDPSLGSVKQERIEGSVTVSYGTPTGSSEGSGYGGTIGAHIGILNQFRSEHTQGAW